MRRRMVIGFESVNPAPARIVEMNADEDRILLRVFDRHPRIERNEDVARSCHHGFDLRFAQFVVEPLRDIEGDDFFRRP